MSEKPKWYLFKMRTGAWNVYISRYFNNRYSRALKWNSTGFKLRLHYFPVIWLWASYSTSLRHSLFICKIVTITAFVNTIVRIIWDNECNVFKQVLDSKKWQLLLLEQAVMKSNFMLTVIGNYQEFLKYDTCFTFSGDHFVLKKMEYRR